MTKSYIRNRIQLESTKFIEWHMSKMERWHSMQDIDGISWENNQGEQIPIFLFQYKHFNILKSNLAINLQQPINQRDMIVAKSLGIPAWMIIYALQDDPDIKDFSNTQFYFIPLNKKAYYMRGWKTEKEYMKFEYEIRKEIPPVEKLEKCSNELKFKSHACIIQPTREQIKKYYF